MSCQQRIHNMEPLLTLIENIDRQSVFSPQYAKPHMDRHATTAPAVALPAHRVSRAEGANRLPQTDKLTPHDMDQLLMGAAEETELDWPEFFDWDPVKTVKEVSLAVSFIAALVGFSILCWDGLGYILNAVFFPPFK